MCVLRKETMGIWKLIEAILFCGGLIYFVDMATDGDIDLPHRIIKIDKNSKLYRFCMKVAKLIERVK